ncbi:MAG: hypothetical protein AAF368_04595 [Planctomycetota bacterium]
MKTLVLASFLLGAWTANEYLFEPKPEHEQTIVRTFRFESEMANEPSGDDEMGGDFEMEMSSAFTCVVADKMGEVEDGTLQSMTREFRELESSMRQSWSAPEMEPEEMEVELASDLQGHTVLFAKGEDPAWAEGDSADDDLLLGLTESMALLEFLPEGVTKVGDTWSLEPSTLLALEEPGGDLKLTPSDGMPSEEMGPDEGEEPEEELSGSIDATLESVEEDEGRRLATIQLEVDIESFVDLTEFYAEMYGGGGEEEPEEGFIIPDVESADSTTSRAGKGQVIWDLDAGRLVSLVLELDVESIETTVMSFDTGQGVEEFEQENVMVGTESYEVNFDA